MHRTSVLEVERKYDYKFQDGGQNGGRANAWLYLKRLYFISRGIAYCISPYASCYVRLSCYIPFCKLCILGHSTVLCFLVVRPFVRPSIRPSVRPSVRQCVRLSVRQFVRTSGRRPSVRPSVHSFVRSFVCSYVHSFIHVFL